MKKTVFVVYEGHAGKENLPAKHPFCKVDPSWKQNEYDSLEWAAVYADKWLGAHSPGIYFLVKEFQSKGEVCYDYNGYGDLLLIKKEERIK